MTVYLPRSAWTTHGPVKTLTPLPSTVRGVAIHWPGDPGHIGTDQASIARRLESYRSYHVNTHGWNDIAYQVAIDLAGRVWDLRGIANQSAANGDATVNQEYGAVLFLVGADDKPSPEMLQAFSDFYRDKWLAKHPRATQIKGHRDVRPAGTDCPGPAVYALISSGRLLQPKTNPEDIVTPAEIEAVADRTVDLLLSRTITTGWQEDGSFNPNKPQTIPLSKVFAGDRGGSLHAAAGVDELNAKVDALIALLTPKA